MGNRNDCPTGRSGLVATVAISPESESRGSFRSVVSPLPYVHLGGRSLLKSEGCRNPELGQMLALFDRFNTTILSSPTVQVVITHCASSSCLSCNRSSNVDWVTSCFRDKITRKSPKTPLPRKR